VLVDFAARGMRVDEVAGGYMFRTNPAYASYVQSFLAQRPVRLSRAQLETLAIVAYRQPITRPEVDDIRGVDCGPVLKGLLERDLIRILGKKDEPGRPMLYGTTQNFLELFSLQSLRELPTLREFTELSDDSRRVFEREMGEDAPEGPFEGGESEGGEPDSMRAPESSSEASGHADEATPDDGLDASEDDEDEDKDEDEDEDDEDKDEDEDDEDDDDEDEDDDDEDDDDEES
jgi:segregation and condensation protein B